MHDSMKQQIKITFNHPVIAVLYSLAVLSRKFTVQPYRKLK